MRFLIATRIIIVKDGVIIVKDGVDRPLFLPMPINANIQNYFLS